MLDFRKSLINRISEKVRKRLHYPLGARMLWQPKSRCFSGIWLGLIFWLDGIHWILVLQMEQGEWH